MKFIPNDESEFDDFEKSGASCPTLPTAQPVAQPEIENEKLRGVICPNCGSALEGRKCKLFCTRRSCGYLVTCSEW